MQVAARVHRVNGQQQARGRKAGHDQVMRRRQPGGDPGKHRPGQGPGNQHREQQPRGIDADIEAKKGEQLGAMEKDGQAPQRSFGTAYSCTADASEALISINEPNHEPL